jgi:hypothetical protein
VKTFPDDVYCKNSTLTEQEVFFTGKLINILKQMVPENKLIKILDFPIVRQPMKLSSLTAAKELSVVPSSLYSTNVQGITSMFTARTFSSGFVRVEPFLMAQISRSS